MPKAIINGQIVAGEELLLGHALVFDRQINDICQQDHLSGRGIEQVIDASGMLISPGLIDTHIHGIAGTDTMDATVKSLRQMSEALASRGITGFLPTTMTAPWPEIERVLATVRQAMHDNWQFGARILGVHLEGPFLSQKSAGAQAAEHLSPPDSSQVLQHRDVIRLVTYAPELDRGEVFARQLLSSGLIPSIGHTAADYETVSRALRAGVRHATHLFNAMPPLHHRQPGPLGAILEQGISCEMIADDLHLHPSIYRLLLRTIGLQRIILISDCMRATGLNDGTHDLGGQAVQVQGGAARLPDGRLAGSVTSLNEAVRRFRAATDLPYRLALRTATTNPAALLGLEEQLGCLSPGMDADLVCFDHEMNAHLTIVQGEVVYQRK